MKSKKNLKKKISSTEKLIQLFSNFETSRIDYGAAQLSR